ncbi:transglutaminase domain-containing protein [Alcanivorax sp. JB21]|uniref:transglutaminase-like domain-containing protein n=1 Tax=Alcanivorax limicola TaxID=2874102 RepID=UPI001CBFC08D|nr:transglutaminase-like domain-containing protein [Alcanivorax limicola]MBZ2189015.1 transglutaminase domain-containing protein [Alcanivorax limicola]
MRDMTQDKAAISVTQPGGLNDNPPPVMTRLRRAGRPMRITISATLLLFLNAMIWPSWAVAIEIDRLRTEQAQQIWEAKNRDLDQVLLHIQQEARGKAEIIQARLSDESGLMERALGLFGLSRLALERTDELQRLAERAGDLRGKAERELNATRQHILGKGLPEEILARHDQAAADFSAAFDGMQHRLEALRSARSLTEQSSASDALRQQMEGFTQEKPRDPFDPNNLPWGTPDPSLTPEPALSAAELSARTGLPLFEQGEQLATHVILPGMLGQPGGPTQADLDETLDAQITPAIIALAEELNHEPAAIYQWVRNNIEFIPSYGSIQGSDYTLQNGKGNAFDTASLLISLLRASNIPARYAFGTVQIPADQVMNWVGGVNVPEAAGNLMGQGGIPNVALATGGNISHFKLEHVWVEAWIDYHPSRGASHVAGDTWVPMDASFKQYEYSEGIGLDDAVPFDAEGLVHIIEQQSTINEQQGWVQGVPQAEVEQALEDYRQELEQYLDDQHEDASVGDVLGMRDIKTVIRETLAASLPYELVTRQLVTAELPDNLRWKFSYQLSTSLYGQPGSTLLRVAEPTVSLVGQPLALSFRPATEADEQTLASFLPEADENGEIDPQDIPRTLPGYLVRLTGEFSIGGETVATASGNTTMGTELITEKGYWQPGRGWQMSRNQPVAGEYRAVALDLQGISAQQAAAVQAELETTRLRLEAEEYTGLTKKHLAGNVLYSTILSYFAVNNIQNEIAARQAGIIDYRAPSYGLFKTSLAPLYWFGLPRNVRINGLTMDVDRYQSYRVHENNDHDQWVAFNRAMGSQMSAMEHLVPEEMFSTEEAPAHGISAVKAIQLAVVEGQRIWTITRDNLNEALAASQLPGKAQTDIRNSVLAGMEVTAHEKPVNFFGKESTGYIVLNPETGAGAYLIGSGENGGELSTPGGTDIISWLLSILDEFGRNPLLKKFGGLLSELITAVNLFKDISSCGYAYGLAKFFAGILVVIGVAFMLLPFIALIVSLHLALWSALFVGSVASSYFGAQWSCRNE